MLGSRLESFIASGACTGNRGI